MITFQSGQNMSHVTRNGGSALHYRNNGLRYNWNHWVTTSEELESRKKLLELGRW